MGLGVLEIWVRGGGVFKVRVVPLNTVDSIYTFHKLAIFDKTTYITL